VNCFHGDGLNAPFQDFFQKIREDVEEAVSGSSVLQFQQGGI
jgi:hypothetical protein